MPLLSFPSVIIVSPFLRSLYNNGLWLLLQSYPAAITSKGMRFALSAHHWRQGIPFPRVPRWRGRGFRDHTLPSGREKFKRKRINVSERTDLWSLPIIVRRVSCRKSHYERQLSMVFSTDFVVWETKTDLFFRKDQLSKDKALTDSSRVCMGD